MMSKKINGGKNAKGVYQKKGDKPDFLFALGAFPERQSPKNHVEQNQG